MIKCGPETKKYQIVSVSDSHNQLMTDKYETLLFSQTLGDNIYHE